MTKLLETLHRIARNLHDAVTARPRAPLAAFLDHEERGEPLR